MAIKLRETVHQEDRFACGHRLCPGCGEGTIIRQVMLATEHPLVVGLATGCLEVCSTIYPYSSWKTSYVHSAFENVGAVVSGVEAAYNAMRRKGDIDKEHRFLAVAGDGGTYDIGFQALSGAMERGHKMVYLCLDNEAYMNTGMQRSSATPIGAHTTTTPIGKYSAGKQERRKDMAMTMFAHHIPYMAQASPSNWNDLMTKAQKAFEADGPAFLNVLAPCPRGWRTDAADSIELAKLAVKTCYWPLFEVENGAWKITHTPREKLPVADFLRPQGRFAHLFKPGNEAILEKLQADVDAGWDKIQRMAAAFPPASE